MDPLGFALENLDAIGRWRDRDGGEPVDAVGTLKDGTTIAGAEGLAAEILSRRKGEFARCLTEHLLTYALGRKREWYDQAAVERIVGALKQNEYRFSTLAVEIVKSRPFRYTHKPPRARISLAAPASFDEALRGDDRRGADRVGGGNRLPLKTPRG